MLYLMTLLIYIQYIYSKDVISPVNCIIIKLMCLGLLSVKLKVKWCIQIVLVMLLDYYVCYV